MKGLYVYGALLMGMCFVVGLDRNGLLVELAIISAGLAALGEALAEYARFRAAHHGDEPIPASIITVVALASWISTALMTVTALFATLQF